VRTNETRLHRLQMKQIHEELESKSNHWLLSLSYSSIVPSSSSYPCVASPTSILSPSSNSLGSSQSSDLPSLSSPHYSAKFYNVFIKFQGNNIYGYNVLEMAKGVVAVVTPSFVLAVAALQLSISKYLSGSL
jgi:hypothetical protein